MATTVAEKVIRIDVVTSANAQRTLNAMAADMKKVESAATNMQRTVTGGFRGINSTLSTITGFLGAFGVTTGMGAFTKWVIESANAYEVLEARLSLVLGSYEKAEKATAEIANISQITGRELDGVAKLYEKAARSAQQFGISEDKVREITLGFSQSIRLSGASTQEAYASLVQFGQALASGRLQGDEFRSLMENNAVFMYEFAKAAGITVSALRKMGTEGKLNAKFLFEVMSKEGADGLNMMERLNKMAQEVPLTFGQSFNSMTSAVNEFIGVLSKLTVGKGDDPQGFFGPLIRSVGELTDRLRDLNKEARLVDEGFWKKFFRLGAGMVEGALLFGAEPKNEVSYTEKISRRVNQAAKDLEAQERRVAQNTKAFQEAYGSEDSAFAKREGTAANARLARLNEERAKLKQLLGDYQSLRNEQRALSYGEGFYADPKPNVKPEPDAAEERRLKSARDSLEDFVKAKEREAEANKRVATGQEDVARTARALVELEGKLKEALTSGNSELAKRGRAAIQQAEYWKKQSDAQEDFLKSEEKLREAERTDLEKVQQQILRDTEAIDALNNKTRATDELTEALLRQKRVEAESEITNMDPNTLGAGNRLDALRVYIAEIDRAIAKKNELMGARADDKQMKEQRKINEENEKRVGDLADEFNTAMKKGILDSGDGKSVGEALRDNIMNMVHNKTIDIIINPVTTVFSRILAQLADQFSAMLTKSLYEMMSNSSSDSLGTFIGLMGYSTGGAGGTTTGGTGFKIPDGFQFAKGLSYVPYDEFPASLHRGERVLTARENSEYSRGGVSISSSPVINIDSRTDQADVHRIVIQAVQQGNVALVEEMRSQGIIS